MKFDATPVFRQTILILAHLLKFEYNLPLFLHFLTNVFIILQPISFVYYYSHVEGKQAGTSLTKITIATRLYIYIQNENIMAALFFTVVVIQHLILFIALIYSYQNRNAVGCSQSKGVIVALLFSLYVYYISIAFYPTIFEICFFNLSSGINIGLFCLITAETLIIMLLGEKMFLRGLTLKSTSQLYINISPYSYLIKFMKILQIIVFFYTSDLTAQVIQSILNILIQVSLITEQLHSKIYANPLIQNTIIVLSSIGIILSSDVLITSSIKNHNYWILLSMILIRILYDLDQQLPECLHKFKIHQLKYLYAKLDLCNPEKTKTKLFVFQLYKSHTNTCLKKLNCTCISYRNKQYKGLLKLIEERIEQIAHGKGKLQRDSSDLINLDYSQILLRRQQYVKAQQHISRCLQMNQSLYGNNQQPYSKVTIFLFEFLKEQVLNDVLIQITEKIILTNQSNKALTDSLKQFVINENTDNEIIQKLRKVILQKIQFYSQFIEHQNTQFGNVAYAIDFIQQIQEFKEVLINRYEQFPSILLNNLATSNQNILKYFELHILNDYIESFNTNKSKALEDDKFNLLYGQQYSKFFGLNPAYFITELNSELDIIITKQSNKAKQLCQIWGAQQYSDQKYDAEPELSKYLPEYVQTKHRELIEQFLDDGKNKYYQQQDLAFLKIKDKIMMPIQIMVSLNQSVTDKFSFLTFFNEYQDYRYYLIADKQLEIINASRNLQETLVSNESKGSNLITKVIPNFPYLLESQQQSFFNQEVRIAKEHQHHFLLQSFNGNIKITKKFENQYECYFIELDNIRQVLRKSREDALSTNHLSSPLLFQSSGNKIYHINTEIEQMYDKAIPYSEEDKPQRDHSLCLLNTEKFLHEQTDTNNMCTQQLVDFYKSSNQIEPASQRKLLLSGNLSNEDEFQKQINNNHNDEAEFNDVGSCSSLTAIRRSKYYKKFEIITILMKSSKQSKKIRKMNGYMTIYLTMILTGLIVVLIDFIQLITMIQHLEQFIKDIQILSLRYQVSEPYESFYVSRFSQVNYREQLGGGYINATQYASLTKFPFATFGLMYTHLRESMYKVIQMEEIDQLSENQTYTITYQNVSYVGYQKNVTIRSLLLILMNYQNDFYVGLTVKSVSFDSAYFYFTTKNYLTVKNTMNGLSKIVLESTLARSSLEKSKWLASLIPFMIFSVTLIILITLKYYEYNQIMNQIFRYLMELDQGVLDNEKQRLQQHVSIITTQLYKVKEFQFDIDAIDVELEESNYCPKQQAQRKQQKKQYVNNHQFKIGFIILLLHVVIYMVFFIAIYFIIVNYFDKYDTTSVVFQKISDLGVDIPTIYAQREVLQRRKLRYSFLSDQEIDGVYAILFKAYDNVIQFQLDSYDLSSNQYLFDEAAVSFYDAVNKGNLCDYQTPQFANLSTTVCPIVMKGNLQNGLAQIIPYILQTIKSQQYETLNFTIQPNTTKLELEGATILGNVMSTVITQLYETLLTSCQTLMLQTQLACILFLICQCFCFFFYIIVINGRFRQQFQSIKQSIFLFPRQTLIFDDQFYRYFRSIIKDEGIQQ